MGYSRQFAAADRVLVLLIENRGVELGIPEIVDKLLSSVPAASLIPDATRQQLVEFIREKIKAVTDSLLETAELSINRYAGAKPEFFGDVVVLRDGTATYDDLRQTLLARSRQGKIIDVLILTHGGQDSIDVTGNVTGQKIRDIRIELGSPLMIRSVYMMNCVGSSLNQAWLDAGARVSSGSIRNNYLPEPTTFFFWQNWKAGKPFEESVTSAYRKTINVMNEAVRGFVRNLPIPGSGTVADALDFENMDFVRDSAPVIQGQRSLTIGSDDLSAAQSGASSLATTVLHVGLLQSLRSTTFEAPATARTRALSPSGLDLIKKWEGFRPALCNENGTCTIGYGTWLHTGPCDGRPVEQPYAGGISQEAATRLLVQRAADVRHVLEDLVTVPLTQNQSDALISLVYDIGGDSFKASTLLQLLNTGNNTRAAAEIRKWTREQRPDGAESDVPSLVSRRQVEADLFLTPDAATAQVLSMSGRRFAGAFAAIDYSIPGVIPVIAQPTPMTCWAAVMTMMVSWKNNRSMAIRDALAQIGPAYVTRFTNGQGLDGTAARTMYRDARLEVIEGLNPTIDGWASSLKKYGPLYVDVGNTGSVNTHAIIVTGISGDGTPAGTQMTWINPAGGQTETRAFIDFLEKYETSGAVQWPYPIVHWPVGALSVQHSLYSHTYSYDSPGFVTKPGIRLSEAKFLPAGIAVTDAAQIGLAGVSVAQAQASASQGSFTLTYDQASRLLTPAARLTYPPIAKSNYTRRLLYLGASRLNAAEADVLIDWAGNAYGEIQTPVIRRNLDTSTEWTKSSASINIRQIGSIPEWTLEGDPRGWPIVFHFEGTYDPWGNGYFEFDGDFRIDAFGGISIRYKVVSRAMADWAVSGTPEQYVQRGADVAGTIPPIPEAQLRALQSNPPS